MALGIFLYNASYIITLSDSTSYGVHFDASLGQLPFKRVLSNSWKRGFQPLAGIDYENRQIVLTLNVKGTSLDNWIATSRLIKDVLFENNRYWESHGVDGSRAYFSVQLAGMSNAAEFDVLSGELNDQDIFQQAMIVNTAKPVVPDAKLLLITKPFGRPQLRTSTVTGTLNNGNAAGYTLSAPSGDASITSPTKLTFQGAAGNTPSRVLIGRKTYAPNFQHLLEAETTSAATYTSNLTNPANGTTAVAAVAAASGGNVARVTSSGAGAVTGVVVDWTLVAATVQDFFGTYRVLVRLNNVSTGWTSPTLQLKYGGAGGTTITLTAVNATNNAATYLVDMGLMTIPHATQPLSAGATTFKFQVVIGGTADGAGRTVDIDCVYLLPIDEEVLDYSANAPFTSLDQVVSDSLLPLPMVYMINSAGKIKYPTVTLNADSRFDVQIGRATRWFGIMLRDGVGTYPNQFSHLLTDQYTLSFEYYQLYGMLL